MRYFNSTNIIHALYFSHNGVKILLLTLFKLASTLFLLF
nr:MAG TPA: hypothetical protein [Caudoviricetes sp.]